MIKSSLFKLKTLAKPEEHIAKILNKILFVFISKTAPILQEPHGLQDVENIRYNANFFTNSISNFIRIFSLVKFILQDHRKKDEDILKKLKCYPLDDTDIKFILDNDLLLDSKEELYIVLEQEFLKAIPDMLGNEEITGNYVNSCKSIYTHVLNYYLKVMNEIDLYPPLKKMIYDILMVFITKVSEMNFLQK